MKRIGGLSKRLEVEKSCFQHAEYARTIVFLHYTGSPRFATRRLYSYEFRRDWIGATVRLFRGIIKCED